MFRYDSSLRKRLRSLPLLVALSYGLGGALWIYFSDRVLLPYIVERDLYVDWQGAKGWFYVAASALFIYLIGLAALHALLWLHRRGRQTEEQLRLFFDAATEHALILLDDRGTVSGWNSGAERLFGYTAEEARGVTFSTLFPDPDQSPNRSRRLLEEARLGTGIELNAAAERKGGRRFTASEWITALRSSSGEPRGFAVLVKDLSSRTKVERDLAESEAKFQTLVEKALVGIYIIQANRFLYVNPKVAEIFGYDRWDILREKSPMDLTAPEDRPRVEENIRKRLEGGLEHLRYQFKGLRRDGSRIDVEVWGSVTEINGMPAVIGTLLDWTDLRALESRYLQSQKMEAVGRLASGIAHDFNNLLTTILGLCEITLPTVPKGQPIHADLLEIQHAAERAAALTRQLLLFSRRRSATMEDVNVGETLRGLERLLHRVLGEDVAVQLGLETDLWTVRADRNQLEQVVINLAINARDAMPNGGEVRIRARNSPDGRFGLVPSAESAGGPAVELAVSDNGSGMDAKTMERIFEPFFTTKAPGKGTGLGLSTVRNIVEFHQGRLALASRPREGTTVSVLFPIAAAATETPAGAAPAGKTILVIDPDESVLMVTRRALEDKGYSVIVARSAPEALLAARSHPDPVTLVIADPADGQDDQSLFEQLSSFCPDLRVLGITPLSDEDAIPPGKDGRIHRLQKPFSPTQLAEKVRTVLRS